MTPRLACTVVAAAVALAARPASAEMASDERPWLGISYQTNGSVGLLVSNVFEESGALASGLRVGDEIVEVEGERTAPGTDLKNLIEPHAIGDRVTMRVYREGRVLTLRPVLSRRLTEGELLHVQLVGKRAPAFSLIPPGDGTSEPIDDSILAGKVGLLTWYHVGCSDCAAMINRISAWTDQRRNDNLVAVAGVGGPLGFTVEQLLTAVTSILSKSPVLLPIGIDQDAWLKYGVLEDWDDKLSVIVIDKRGFVRMAAVVSVADDGALDDVFAAADRLLKPRRPRR